MSTFGDRILEITLKLSSHVAQLDDRTQDHQKWTRAYSCRVINNTTDVQSDIHSTDTHGANEINFAILHLFSYQFAPRYRDIYDKVSGSLYGFQHPSHYEEKLLKPIRKLNTALIIEE